MLGSLYADTDSPRIQPFQAIATPKIPTSTWIAIST